MSATADIASLKDAFNIIRTKLENHLEILLYNNIDFIFSKLNFFYYVISFIILE